jgi:hypothetical protein
MSSSKYWNFHEFWMIPSWWQYQKQKKKTKGLFKDLPSNEEKVILALYSVFKNIEVASIVLRFIDPVNYGIISPPVRFAFGQKAKDTYTDEYLDYLSVLRSLAMEYGFNRVADADIALWTLVEKCLRAGSPGCENFRRYQEKMIAIEEEYIQKTQLYKKMTDEVLELAGELADEESAKKQKELENLRDELRSLVRETDRFPLNLLKLEKSNRKAKEKIIHDRREPEVDGGQKYFMQKLAEDTYVNQIIWSENITAKHPTRISAIRDEGELVVLYVAKDNYAAKLKVRPVRCPDRTHARFFAILISRSTNIPVMED